jgi:serine protease Do
MKQRSIFSAFILAAAMLVPASLLAQHEEKVKEKQKEKKDVEEIVIIRKGDNKEKVVVEIVGEKITVNGKPIEELKDGDVTVRRNRIKDLWAFADGMNGAQGNWNFNGGRAFTFSGVDSNRAMLGVSSEMSDKGVRVESITKGSAAEKAGLKEDDIITKVGDKKITTTDELTEAIKKQKPGDKVDVTYLREGKEQKATAELGRWKGSNVFSTVPGQQFKMQDYNFHFDDVMPRTPAPSVPRTRSNGVFQSSGSPKLGLSVQDTDDGKGVKVIDVADESNAAKAGLKENDVITEVDSKAVNSADEVAKIIRESKDKVSVMMKLQRNGKTQNVEVKIPRKLKTANL